MTWQYAYAQTKGRVTALYRYDKTTEFTRRLIHGEWMLVDDDPILLNKDLRKLPSTYYVEEAIKEGRLVACELPLDESFLNVRRHAVFDETEEPILRASNELSDDELNKITVKLVSETLFRDERGRLPDSILIETSRVMRTNLLPHQSLSVKPVVRCYSQTAASNRAYETAVRESALSGVLVAQHFPGSLRNFVSSWLTYLQQALATQFAEGANRGVATAAPQILSVAQLTTESFAERMRRKREQGGLR